MKVKKFSEFVKTTQEPYTGPKYVVAPQPHDKGFELVKAALDALKTTDKTVDTGMWSLQEDPAPVNVMQKNQGTDMMHDKLNQGQLVFNTGIWTNT